MVEFQDSLETGCHKQLKTLEGDWEGVTKTWLEPGVLSDESASKSTFRPMLSGRFMLQEYEGTLNGEPHEGAAIFGYNLQARRFEHAWVDSFHNGTGIMFSEGSSEMNSMAALGSFPDGSDGPDWGWRTELQIKDTDHIDIAAYIITPDGQEAMAVLTELARII
ncbi:MAG: DUF1579 domain-containing protein [Chloroflexi bacterium]|nr:DUF1579 domain-containing protein [Chloroflexota bacterium]MDA1226341.1 DUF1579 domain-containing protein [Chloroflexota bacterium]